MSSQRITYGLVAVIDRQLEGDERNDLYDALHDDEMMINYEGTLIYHIEFDGESWESEFVVGTPAYGSNDDFVNKIHKHGLSIVPGTIDTFHANWYDGCDSPMSDLTVKAYMGGK